MGFRQRTILEEDTFFDRYKSSFNEITAVEGFINAFRLEVLMAPEITSDEGGCLRDIT